MAIFHLQINTVGRAQGRNAPASAAYRAGESIRDERTGTVYDHRKREDVLHKEIILPEALQTSGAAPQWLRERSSLWNAAERAEHQHNSRVAREYVLALPAELSPGQRVALAQAFSREIAERFHVAVDLAVHAPRPHGDPRNFHAHLLSTTREVTAQGLGAKSGLDRLGTVRAELGAPSARQQFKALRARWAELANEALHAAHSAARIDHRSLAEQGIDREPRPRLPVAAVAALRRGERSVAAERLFERYRQRVADRTAARGSAAEPARLGRQSAAAPDRAAAPTVTQDGEVRRRQAVRDWLAYRAGRSAPVGPQEPPQTDLGRDIEDVRRTAVETWRSLRAKEGESPGRERSPGLASDGPPSAEPCGDRGHDLSG